MSTGSIWNLISSVSISDENIDLGGIDDEDLIYTAKGEGDWDKYYPLWDEDEDIADDAVWVWNTKESGNGIQLLNKITFEFDFSDILCDPDLNIIPDIQETICDDPTPAPTTDPTIDPTADPTVDPTADPTVDPTIDPTADPTVDPTIDPTADPTIDPTVDPTTDPTVDPTADPTIDPTVDPTTDPTVDPTTDPTIDPTTDPTTDPTESPLACNMCECYAAGSTDLIILMDTTCMLDGSDECSAYTEGVAELFSAIKGTFSIPRVGVITYDGSGTEIVVNLNDTTYNSISSETYEIELEGKKDFYDMIRGVGCDGNSGDATDTSNK